MTKQDLHIHETIFGPTTPPIPCEGGHYHKYATFNGTLCKCKASISGVLHTHNIDLITTLPIYTEDTDYSDYTYFNTK